jgi:uncharacterized membrane protein
MDTLKAIVLAVGLLILCPVAGGAVGFGVGALAASASGVGMHDAGILMAIFILGGAGLGLVAGIAAAYWYAIKPQSN